LRRDGAAGLPDLGRVRVPARVDHGARGRDGAAERLRELLAELEALRAAEPAPAGDDHLRVLDRRAAPLLVRLLEHLRGLGEVVERGARLLDLGLAARLLRVEGARAEEREPRLAAPADVDVDRVLERRPLAHEPPVLAHEA